MSPDTAPLLDDLQIIADIEKDEWYRSFRYYGVAGCMIIGSVIAASLFWPDWHYPLIVVVFLYCTAMLLLFVKHCDKLEAQVTEEIITPPECQETTWVKMLVAELGNAASNCKLSVAVDSYGNRNSSRGRRNTTSLLNVVLDNSPSASTSRGTMEGRVFDNSQEQIQNNLEVEFLTTTAALPSCSGILPYNEENCTQQEDTCLQGQDLNATSASVADQEMAHQMDIMSSPITISNPENYFGMESFPVLPSHALDQHGEQASAPSALFREKLCYGSNGKLGRKYKSYDPKGHLLSGAAISRQLDDESFECGDSMPEFESFDVSVEYDSPTIGKRPFESLDDSNAASGVWGTLSGKPRNYSFSDDLQQSSASDSRSIMDSFGCGLELDSFFIADAVASCSSDANRRQEINEIPLTPSVEKYSLRKLSSRSGSGSEHMSSIPELECFRIDEDNSIPEEDEYQDRLAGSVDVNCSRHASGRKALQDITGLCQNNGNSPSVSTRCMDSSAESFSSELNHHSNIRNDHVIIKPKRSHPTSVKREGKASRSLNGRLGTAENPSSRNGRHGSEANVGTHFIPLVKQKMQPVKKGVKVKALKAAEAAKRLEEKKQKEQEMRKAAAKVQRERLKREKELKQKLEEEQKKKRDEEEKKKGDEDEQKKKREVDVATKKRQRKEGEKKETMRKRKCIDEARKQQKQPMDRRRGTKDDKDARQKASDNTERRKNVVDVGKNQVDGSGGGGEAPMVFSRACELYVAELTRDAWAATLDGKRRTVHREDVAQAIRDIYLVDFLVDVVKDDAGGHEDGGVVVAPVCGRHADDEGALE